LDTRPQVSKDVADPLSSLSDETPAPGGEGGGWKQYYEDLELVAEIQKDLDRLYPNGCDEEHFTGAQIQNVMMNILFTWSSLHRSLSYRQVCGAQDTVVCL
jgi:hypothetical protein